MASNSPLNLGIPPLSLTPEAPTPSLNLTSTQGPQYSPEHTDDLALKYHSALGDLSPGQDSVHDRIVNNDTTGLASLLAQRNDLAQQQAKNDVVQQIALRNQGQVPTQQDIDVVQGLSETQLQSHDLSTILDQEYAKKAVNTTTVLANKDTGLLDQAMADDPDKTLDVLDRVEFQGARNMVVTNLIDQVQKKYDQGSPLVKGDAWANQLIPLASAYTVNTFTGTGSLFELPGTSAEEQYARLSTMPPSEMKQVLQDGIDRAVSREDYFGAISFLQGYEKYSDSDAGTANILTGLDIASVAPIGIFAKAIKGAARVVRVPLTDLPRAAQAAGLPATAVQATMQAANAAGQFPSQVIRNITDAETTVSSLSRPTEAFTGQQLKAGAPALNRLQTAAMARADAAGEVLFNTNRVERLDPEALDQAFVSAQDELWNTFNHANHQIVNVTRNQAEDNIGNVYSVTMSLGRKDGGMYSTEGAAKNAASKFIKLKTNDYQVVQLDNGWAIDVHRNVDETAASLKGVTFGTDSEMPDNFITRFTGYGIGADNKLSKLQTQARGVAVMSSEHDAHLMQSFTEPLSQLSKGENTELQSFLERTRDYVDPEKGRGITYNNIFDFEDAFHSMYSKLPSEKQLDAYWSIKQAYDLDWLVRDADVLKQKVTRGWEHFTMPVKGEQLAFDGKAVSSLPRGHTTPFRIAVVDSDGTVQKGNDLWTRSMDQKAWDRVQAKIDDGYQIIQAVDGGHVKVGEDNYNFILARNFKRDRIGMMNLNYKQGSRVISKHPYFVKQPNISIQNGLARYLGDTTLANARSLPEGENIERVLNEARKKVAANATDAEAYFRENLPVWNYDSFMKAVKAGNVNLKVPFKLVRSGVRTIDAHDVATALKSEGNEFSQFVTDDAFDDSRFVRGRFLGERDDTDMKTWASEKGSIFELDGSPLMSPFDTLRTSMSSMIDTHVFSDYRLKSARDFTNNFGDVLDGSAEDFDQNGLKFIFDPLYRSGADPNRIKTAEGVRKAILSLFNHQTIVDRQIDMYKERIVAGMRDTFGDKGAWVADGSLTRLKNADSFMRAFAYHTKMGFFNPTQFFKQINTAVNVIAISPLHGIRGAALYSPMTAALYAKTPEMVRAIGERVAGLTRMPADDFVEMLDSFKRSGWGHVGGDLAYVDDLASPTMDSKVGNILSKSLDAGTVFFKKGERLTRKMAYATAYSEKKAMIGTRALNRADEAWILQRSKDLTGNMTRDSNAAYQSGYGAIATQFFGYQMRLAEQMWGNKLTTAERFRLRAGMAMVYGVPVAASMTFGIIPFRQWLSDSLAENGVNYHDIPGAELFMDGFAHQFLKSLTGADLDVAGAYGPGGLTTFYDLLKGDLDFQKMFLGASGGIIGQTVNYADPIIKAIHSSIDLNDQTNYPFRLQDLLEPLRTISTVNAAMRLQQAINVQQWVSSNQTNLTDTTTSEAIIGAISGLSPQRVSDSYNKLDALKVHKELQSSGMKEVTKNYKLAIQALRAGDNPTADQFFARMKAEGVLAGLSMKQMNQAFNQAIQAEPLDESVMRTWQQKFQNGVTN